MKFILGGVQLGMHYGISNANSKMSLEDVSKILQRASKYHIDTIDTAIKYGDSETFIGNAKKSKFKIITKLPYISPDKTNNYHYIKKQVLESIKRLRIKSLQGLLLHEPIQLTQNNGKKIWECLKLLKDEKLTLKIGYSIDDINLLDNLIPDFLPDIVQVPLNILDQRIIKSGWLKKMNEMSIEVHIRSIFLQGLLLMDSNDRPKKFDQWKEFWSQWENFLKKNKITAYEACINFILLQKGIDKIVIGVNSVKHLDNLFNFKKLKLIDFKYLPKIDDLNLIQPSRW